MTLSRITWSPSIGERPGPYRTVASMTDSSDQTTSDTAPARLSELSRSIAGQVAIVTGAASGMGRATAFLFADEGARVVVADLGADRVAAAVDEIIAVHGP